MFVGAASTAGRSDAVLRLLPSGSPVFVFDVRADAIDRADGRGHRADVRLIGCVRETPRRASERVSDSDFSAVLVLRSLTPSRLLSCVRSLTAGSATGTADADRVIADAVREPPTGAHPPLSERELDVLRRLADGDTTREIALRLSYSERTVKTIVRDALDKLGCRTRAHAVAVATRRGVI